MSDERKAQSTPRFGIAGGRPFNHYVCETCGAVTITKHEDDGVTPFIVGCRATPGCSGLAQSLLYSGPQGDDQQPHIIWHRPQTSVELDHALSVESSSSRVSHLPYRQRLALRDQLREHFNKGGCLMRLTERV